MLTSCLLGYQRSWRESLLSVSDIFLLLGRILSVMFVCLGSDDREQTYAKLQFLAILDRGITGSELYLDCCWCLLEPSLIVSWVLLVVCGFFFFFFFSHISPHTAL